MQRWRIYLRLVDTGDNVHIAFVMGKSRLAPLREISIPRLELTAAVLSVRLSAIIREELDMSIQRTYYWTDSMSVLKCITNQTKRFHTFESNRLTVIHTVLPRSNLTHAVRSRFVRFAAAVRAVRGYGSCGLRLRFVRFAATIRAVSGRGSCGSRLRFMRFLSRLSKNHCGIFRNSPSFTFYYATIVRC